MGRIAEVFSTGATDVWIVRGAAGEEVLVPVQHSRNMVETHPLCHTMVLRTDR